jgi:diphthamide synthase subunit DPH2
MDFLLRPQTLFRRPTLGPFCFSDWPVLIIGQGLFHPILQGVHTDVQFFRNDLNRPVSTAEHRRQGPLFKAIRIRRFLHALDIL